MINKAWNAWMEFNNRAKKARSCSIGKTTIPQQHSDQITMQRVETTPVGKHLRIVVQWNKEGKAAGYGIVASDEREHDLMGWALRESN